MFRVLFVLVFVGCAPVIPKPTVMHVSLERRDEFETLIRTMETAARERGVPGGAIAVVENGELAHAAGFGLRHAERPEGVTPKTIFRIASSGKTFVAATALSLVDSGELKLDAPIHELPVTLRQALNHTSGLADRGELKCAQTIEQWLTEYLPGAQRTPPGRGVELFEPELPAGRRGDRKGDRSSFRRRREGTRARRRTERDLRTG